MQEMAAHDFLNASNLTLILNDSNLTESESDKGGWSYGDTFEFAVHGVLVSLVGVFGLVGNIISIVILSRPQMKSSINAILIGKHAN